MNQLQKVRVVPLKVLFTYYLIYPSLPIKKEGKKKTPSPQSQNLYFFFRKAKYSKIHIHVKEKKLLFTQVHVTATSLYVVRTRARAFSFNWYLDELHCFKLLLSSSGDVEVVSG